MYIHKHTNTKVTSNVAVSTNKQISNRENVRCTVFPVHATKAHWGFLISIRTLRQQHVTHTDRNLFKLVVKQYE